MAGCTRRLKQRDRSSLKIRSRNSPQTVAGNIQQGKSMKNVLARSFNTPLGMEVSISFRFVEFGLGTFRFVFVVFCFELRVSSPWRDVRGGSSRETAAISK